MELRDLLALTQCTGCRYRCAATRCSSDRPVGRALWLLKTAYVLAPLQLQTPRARLSRDDVRPDLACADAPRNRAVPRRASPRGTRPTPSTAGAPTVTAAKTAFGEAGPMALDVAVALLERVANRARHREAGDRHRVAPSGLPAVLDVEESPAQRSTDSRRGSSRSDPDDGARQSALGSAPNSRGELIKLGLAVSRRPSRNTCLAGPHRRRTSGAPSSRTTSTRSRPPTSSSCRPPRAGCCLCW